MDRPIDEVCPWRASPSDSVAARDLERLGQSDVGIILFRKQLQAQMAIVADGGEPMNVFRDDPGTINLPMEAVKHGNRADGRYYPGEAGLSSAEELIKEVLKTWVDAEHMPEAIPRLH